MALILHLLFAFGSIGATTYAYFRPSIEKLRASYVLVALTFISGFFLVFTKPAHLVSACATGLVYLAVVMVGVLAVQRKLAKAEERV